MTNATQTSELNSYEFKGHSLEDLAERYVDLVKPELELMQEFVDAEDRSLYTEEETLEAMDYEAFGRFLLEGGTGGFGMPLVHETDEPGVYEIRSDDHTEEEWARVIAAIR